MRAARGHDGTAAREDAPEMRVGGAPAVGRAYSPAGQKDPPKVQGGTGDGTAGEHGGAHHDTRPLKMYRAQGFGLDPARNCDRNYLWTLRNYSCDAQLRRRESSAHRKGENAMRSPVDLIAELDESTISLTTRLLIAYFRDS